MGARKQLEMQGAPVQLGQLQTSLTLTRTGHQSSDILAEASDVSAARHVYGLSSGAIANEGPSERRGFLPLLLLVVGLAVATTWFVAVPALDTQPRAERSCEVFVVGKGSTRCVAKPTAEALLAAQQRSGRAKR